MTTSLPIPNNPREHYRPLRRLALDAWRTSGMPQARRRLRYIDEILSLRCTEDLLHAGLFPSTAAAKEMTESMGIFNAVRHHVPWVNLKDPTTTAIVIGDGSTPRTAAVFALRTRWQVHSVDPILRTRWAVKITDRERETRELPYGIDRLTLHPRLAEEVHIPAPKDVVLVAMHSHAEFDGVCHTIGLANRRRLALAGRVESAMYEVYLDKGDIERDADDLAAEVVQTYQTMRAEETLNKA